MPVARPKAKRPCAWRRPVSAVQLGGRRDSHEESAPLSVVGFPVIRPTATQPYWIAAANTGNVDLSTSHVFVQSSKNAALQIGEEGIASPLNSGEGLHVSLFEIAPGETRLVPMRVTALDSLISRLMPRPLLTSLN